MITLVYNDIQIDQILYIKAVYTIAFLCQLYLTNIQIQVHPLPSCVILDKLLDFFVISFSHVLHGNPSSYRI